jgi:lysophospholipase L1-like esterase
VFLLHVLVVKVLFFQWTHGLTRIFLSLLFMLLVGCGAAEAATAVPTPTAALPTPTMTPLPTNTPAPTPTPACAPRTENPLRYLALGDSYTIGESVAEAERWPVQLVDVLRDQGVNIAEPEIIAKTGWTTDELAEAITTADPAGPYDLVSLLIGVNNQYRGRSEAEYRAQFVDLLETAVTLANNNPNRLFVVSIPDWGVTPFGQGRDFRGVSEAIDTFNAINREETSQRSIAYIDITQISRQVPDNPALIAGDGLHPSGAMYTLWVAEMQPAVCRLLSNQ